MKPTDYRTEPHPADVQPGPPPERPTLPPGLVKLRDQCGLLVLPVIVGKHADGTPLWTWGVWDAGTGKELAWSCRHSPETYEQRLWDFLTGYSTGMSAFPF